MKIKKRHVEFADIILAAGIAENRMRADQAKKSLRKIVESTDTPLGRAFDWIILGLILISIITMTLESYPGVRANYGAILYISEVSITALFTCEYALRIWVSERRREYILGAGIIDFLAIAPFYLNLLIGLAGLDLRALRALRMLRLLRLLKVSRYNAALNRFGRAFQLASKELVLYTFVTIVLLYIAASGIYVFENTAQPENFSSIPQSLWWALATLTTVGYGDVYPITAGGQVFTFFVLMTGLGVVAVPAGLIASAMNQARDEEDAEEDRQEMLEQMEARLDQRFADIEALIRQQSNAAAPDKPPPA